MREQDAVDDAETRRYKLQDAMIDLIDPSTVELVHFPLPCLWFNVQCGCIGCYEQNYQVMRRKVCSNQTLKFFQTMWRDKTVWPLLVHPNSKVSSEGRGIIATRLAVRGSLDMPSNCWFPPKDFMVAATVLLAPAPFWSMALRNGRCVVERTMSTKWRATGEVSPAAVAF